MNVDQKEIEKFSTLASRWWDTEGEFKPLHEINPLRLAYIAEQVPLANQKIVDIGCGGGILTEAMAKAGAIVTGIDLAEASLEVANLHLLESKLSVNYQCIAAEDFAKKHAGEFDIVTCLEMLEHVPDPQSIINACSTLLKPGGHLFVSTINRNFKAFLYAIVGAEHILNMLPKGTHEYQKFIRPAELTDWLRKSDMHVLNASGLTYHPLNRSYGLTPEIDVNYILYAQKSA